MKEKKRKKLLIWLLAVVFILAFGMTVALFALNRYLNSPQFLNRIRAEAREKAGVELELEGLKASLFRGFSIQNFSLASPVKGEPPVIKVDQIILKYSLKDLLSKKITINEIVVNRPQIKLKKDSQGNWNLPRVKKPEKKKKTVPQTKKKKEVKEKENPAWKTSIDSLSIKDGSVELLAGFEYDPVKLTGLNLAARLHQLTGKRDIEAHLTLASASLKEQAVVKDLSVDLHLKGSELEVSGLKGIVSEGKLAGAFNIALPSQQAPDKTPISIRGAANLKGVQPASILKKLLGREELKSGVIDLALKVKGELPRPDGELTISASDLKLKQAGRIDRVDMNLKHQQGELNLEKMNIWVYGGQLSAWLKTRFPEKDQPLPLQGEIQIKDIKAEKAFREFSQKGSPPVQGPIFAELTIGGSLAPRGRTLPEIKGRIFSPQLNLQKLGPVEKIEIPLELKREMLKAEGIEALLAGGMVTGTVTANLKNFHTIPYGARFDLEGVDVHTLKEEMSAGRETKMEVSGKMYGKVMASGDATNPDSLKAEGDVNIKEGSLSGHPIQNLIARLTGQKRLKNIEFDQATATFNFARRIFSLTDLIIYSHKVKIASRGTVDFNRGQYMDFKIRLNFHKDLVDDIKPKELRYALEPIDPDKDYRGIEFGVWGPPGNLQTDYQEVLLKKSAAGWLKHELLKKKDKEEERGKPEKKKPEEELIDEAVDSIFKIFK